MQWFTICPWLFLHVHACSVLRFGPEYVFVCTGGRNGYGAKLCNIFSTKFTVETSSKEYDKAFKQEWTNNMAKTTNAKISPAKGSYIMRYTLVQKYHEMRYHFKTSRNSFSWFFGLCLCEWVNEGNLLIWYFNSISGISSSLKV